MESARLDTAEVYPFFSLHHRVQGIAAILSFPSATQEFSVQSHMYPAAVLANWINFAVTSAFHTNSI